MVVAQLIPAPLYGCAQLISQLISQLIQKKFDRRGELTKKKFDTSMPARHKEKIEQMFDRTKFDEFRLQPLEHMFDNENLLF
jgi:hypothetical protein